MATVYMYTVLKSSSEIAVNDRYPLYLKFSKSQLLIGRMIMMVLVPGSKI